MTSSDKVLVTVVTDGNTASGPVNLFPRLELDDDAIPTYLSSCPLYSSEIRRWSEIPNSSDLNMDSEPLRGAFNAIYSAILDHFNLASPTPRWLIKTRGSAMQSRREASFVHQDGSPFSEKCAPDFCILAARLTCSGLGDLPPSEGYPNCISPLEVVRESALDLHGVEMNLYTFAWQCFANQPHRRHVNSVLMTDKKVYLYVHDRHSTFRTKGYDIHAEAPTLVRILLGLASDNADSIGLDPQVVYEQQGSSITFSNNLSSEGSGIKHPKKLKVVGLLPHRSLSVRGKGTICWNVRMPTEPDQRLILKDYWRPFRATPEWEIMKLLRGLPGVAQIVGYDDDASATISSLRACVIDGGSSIHPEDDLIFTRILSEAYGNSFEDFDSPIHLLRAFRDAIFGHANMWRAGVLHQDVSINNILHGIPCANSGERGKMIDFDMATLVSEITKMSTTGTRPFQSAMLLVSANMRHSQDHLDDLESFLYILLYIFCKYNGPGKPLPGYPVIFDEFGCDDDTRARSHRRRVLDGTTTMQSLVTPYFSHNPVILRLLDDLAKFFKGIYKQKMKLRRQCARNIAKSTKHDDPARDEQIIEALPTLLEIHKADLASDPMGKAHRGILALVDSAIIGLEYMQEEETIKAARNKSLGNAEFRDSATLKHGAKRARSSMQEMTNVAAKPKRLKEAVPVLKMKMKQDENRTG